MLHLWCKGAALVVQGAALLPALLFESLYSGLSVGRRTSFLHSIILNRRSRQFFILHSSFFILHSNCCIALCKPAATELESKNAHGVSDFLRSLYTDSFFDFILIFVLILIVPCRTRGIVDGL